VSKPAADAPVVPYGPPLPAHVPPRWRINKRDALVLGAKVAAPFVIGAIFKAMSKR